MPLDSLPGSFIVPLRTDTRELYLRSYRVRNPNALTTENTFPWIDASCQADVLQLVFRDAVVANNSIALSTSQGTALDQRLKDLGMKRLGAIGASGYVAAETSAGGSTIFVDDEIKDTATGLRFKCNATALYFDGDPVPIVGIDIGEQTSLDGGTVLTWTSPRPGCGSNASVITQADGISGLTGGHGVETDIEAITRAINKKANPPASGNDAQYQSTGAETPAIAVQQIFTYPCILGSGSMAFTFTVRPSRPGASRIPNGAQITAVLTYLMDLMPGDDQIYPSTIAEVPTNVAFKVVWARGTPGWTDQVPWPAYYANPGQAIIVQSAASATSFVLKTQNSVYTAIPNPSVGQSIAFYDVVAQLFRRKTILSFTGTGPWTITVDTSNAISDTGYVPIVNQRTCPWSDSLNLLPPSIVGYFDSLGPGEQVPSFFDPGLRQRRSPESPASFANQISGRITIPLLNLSAIQDVALIEPAVPYSATYGIAGSLSYMITLQFIAVFPQ